MCQLLGMNCAALTDFSFSLKGFCRRGGETDIHSHGFGICVYEGRGVRCFHDTKPACQSPIAQLVQNYPLRTYNMVAHIRYATRGEVRLENVHPFSRVWKGIQMTFCHNGDCPAFVAANAASNNVANNNNNNEQGGNCDDEEQPTPGPVLLGQTRPNDVIYHPVGDTDSEAVFCAILNAMTVEFPDGLPTLPVLHEFLSCLCNEIINSSGRVGSGSGQAAAADENPQDDEEGENNDNGCNDNNDEDSNNIIFNFLLGCGQYTLFAYSWPGRRPGSSVWNGLHYIVRQPPFSTARLLDTDYEIDFAQVNTPPDRIAVITTTPLTEEPGWREFAKGELIMFDKGLPYRTPQCCEVVEREGRGLYSKAVSVKCRRRWMRQQQVSSALSSADPRQQQQQQQQPCHLRGGNSILIPQPISIENDPRPAEVAATTGVPSMTTAPLSQHVQPVLLSDECALPPCDAAAAAAATTTAAPATNNMSLREECNNNFNHISKSTEETTTRTKTTTESTLEYSPSPRNTMQL